ncbi:TetR/AcrR family transcriptional regulator [Microbacterium sp. CGR1]|uniref:TetR/AcrR family transcriptional regulator n=1 Tax=Microbacterium sp. CGR1 TaxID=1696072 RepID=UPI003DA24278
MPGLPEHSSDTAARILAAASDLLLRRGERAVTIAEVAQRAKVGKGTVYLYWASRTDLIFGLIARDFLALAEEFTRKFSADPDLARPSRLFPELLRTAPGRPFVRAVLLEDEDLLGVLAADPRSKAITDALGPEKLMMAVLPSWRAGSLASDDWTLEDQAYAVLAVFRGFLFSHELEADGDAQVDTPEIFGRSMAAVLGEKRAAPGEVTAASETIIRYLEEGTDLVLSKIAS